MARLRFGALLAAAAIAFAACGGSHGDPGTGNGGARERRAR